MTIWLIASKEPIEEQVFLENWREQVGDMFAEYIELALLDVSISLSGFTSSD